MNEIDENRPPAGGNAADQKPTLEPSAKEDRSPVGRRALIYTVSLAAAFLVGFVPMWLQAGGRAKERDAAQRELRLMQVQLTLGSAAIDARRGEYEAARLSAVNFFTTLTAEMGRGADSAIPPAQRDALKPIFQQRDDLVTLLARSDPASADRLANLYVAYRKVMGQ